MKIIIAYGRKLVSDSVKLIVTSQPGCEVLGCATGIDAISTQVARAGEPVTVICGARLDDGDAGRLIRRLKGADQKARVVVLITPNELSFARDALRAGAAAVCLVDDIHTALPPILRTGEADMVAMSAPLMARILQQDADRLTRREHEIMALLSEGLTNFQISARLGLSQNTVKYYLKTIFQKLEVTSRGAAIAKYVSGEI